VVCAVPFQFTTALALKELPLTVKVKPWPPALAVLGMICEIAGTIPACGGVVLGELYPHPKLNIASNSTHIAFMSTSIPRLRMDFSKGETGECQAGVIFV
jgi:hypothetical protein